MVGKAVYGAGLDQQVVCATHGFDDATCGSKLWYYPLHKLLEPSEKILKLIFPSLLDVSDDAATPHVLDVVDAAAWVLVEEVTPSLPVLASVDYWSYRIHS
ncbi:MAG: hypothetical protein HC767_00015 [Akkermansiaceae bacterium]|nr:hypothetical protein [Akkermansiaceae bacterium]